MKQLTKWYYAVLVMDQKFKKHLITHMSTQTLGYNLFAQMRCKTWQGARTLPVPTFPVQTSHLSQIYHQDLSQ